MDTEPLMAVRGNAPVKAPFQECGGLLTRERLERTVVFQMKCDLAFEPPSQIRWWRNSDAKVRKIGGDVIGMMCVQRVNGTCDIG